MKSASTSRTHGDEMKVSDVKCPKCGEGFSPKSVAPDCEIEEENHLGMRMESAAISGHCNNGHLMIGGFRRDHQGIHPRVINPSELASGVAKSSNRK